MGGIIESDPDFNRYTFDIGKRGSGIYIASAAAAMSNTRKKQEAPTSSDDDDDGNFSREREWGICTRKLRDNELKKTKS